MRPRLANDVPRPRSLAARMLARIEVQLAGLQEDPDNPFGRDRRLKAIRMHARQRLAAIDLALARGDTLPGAGVRLSPSDPPPPPGSWPESRPLRLGVYPINGNPLHWGHVLCALGALAEERLDQVVFVVQGIDERKREMSQRTQEHRHAMTRRFLRLLDPLISYSDIGHGNSHLGEENLFRLLALNPGRAIDATYIVGGDHYRLIDEAGRPDTPLRLAALMADPEYGFDSALHNITLLFAERGRRLPAFDSPLDVRFIPEALDSSSTAIRAGDVALVPLTVLRYIRDNPAYAAILGLEYLCTGARGAPFMASRRQPWSSSSSSVSEPSTLVRHHLEA